MSSVSAGTDACIAHQRSCTSAPQHISAAAPLCHNVSTSALLPYTHQCPSSAGPHHLSAAARTTAACQPHNPTAHQGICAEMAPQHARRMAAWVCPGLCLRCPMVPGRAEGYPHGVLLLVHHRPQEKRGRRGEMGGNGGAGGGQTGEMGKNGEKATVTRGKMRENGAQTRENGGKTGVKRGTNGGKTGRKRKGKWGKFGGNGGKWGGGGQRLGGPS